MLSFLVVGILTTGSSSDEDASLPAGGARTAGLVVGDGVSVSSSSSVSISDEDEGGEAGAAAGAGGGGGEVPASLAGLPGYFGLMGLLLGYLQVGCAA